MGNAQTHKLLELTRRGQVIHKPYAHTLGDRDGDVVGKDGGSAVYLVPASFTNTTRLHGGDLVIYEYRKDKAWYWALGTIVCVESPLESKLKEPRAHRLPRLSVRRRTQVASTSAEDAAKEVQYRIRNWVLVKNTLPGPDTQAASLKLLLHALSSSSSSSSADGEGEGVNEGEVHQRHVQRGCDAYGSNTNPTSFSLHREPSLAVIEVSASYSLHPEKSGTGGNACQTMYDELLARAEWSSWQGLLRELRAFIALHNNNNNNAATCDEAEGDGVPYVTRQVLIAMLHLLHFLPDAAAVQPVQSAEEEWQQARAALCREDFMDTFQAFSALAQLGIDTLSEIADPIFDDVRERAHYVKHHIFTTEAASATLPAITAASVAATGPQTTKLYDWVQWQMSVLRAVEQKWQKEAEEGIERDARHRRSLSALLHDLHRRGLVFVPPQLPTTTTTNSDVCHEGSHAMMEHIVPSSAIFGRMCCEAVVQGRVTLTCKELELLQSTAAAHHHNTKHGITNNTTTTNNITQTCEATGQPACVALSSEEVSLHEESPTVDAVIDLAACTNNAPSYNEELTTPLLLRQVGEVHDVGSEHQHITSSSNTNNSCSAHTSVTSDKMVTHISLSVTHHNDDDNVNEVRLCGAEMGNVEVNEWTAVASVMELIYSERGGRLALALAEVSARYELHMSYVRQSSELNTHYTVHMPSVVASVNMPQSQVAQLYSLSAQEQCERAEWCTREQKACLDLLHRMPQEAYDLQRMKLAHDYACRLETLRYTIRQKQRRHVAAVNLLQEAQAAILVDCVALQKSASVRVLLSKMREALTLLAEDECEGDFLHITSLPRSLARDLHQHYPVHTCSTVTGEKSKKHDEERALERRRELTRRLSVPPVCLPTQQAHNHHHHHHQTIKTNKDGSKLYVCTKELNARPMSALPSAKCILPEEALMHAETEHEIELAQLRRLLEMQKARTQAAERQISALQERLQGVTSNNNSTNANTCDAKVNYERALLVKRMAALYDTLQGRHRLAEDEEHDRREEAETELRLLHALREAMPQEALPESAQAALRACVAMVEQRRNGLAHERTRRLREEEQLSDFFRTVDTLLDTTSSV